MAHSSINGMAGQILAYWAPIGVDDCAPGAARGIFAAIRAAFAATRRAIIPWGQYGAGAGGGDGAFHRRGNGGCAPIIPHNRNGAGKTSGIHHHGHRPGRKARA